jgi:hypothetical protein
MVGESNESDAHKGNGDYWHRQDHSDIKQELRDLSLRIERATVELDSVKFTPAERLALTAAAAKLTSDTAIFDARARGRWYRKPEVLIPVVASATTAIIAIIALLR